MRPTRISTQTVTSKALTWLAIVLFGCCTVACTAPPATRNSATGTSSVAPTATTLAGSPSPPARTPVDAGKARHELSSLTVNDHPHSLAGYTRELFRQWLDVDGYGCDARQELVIEASVVPPAVAHCKVSSGRWVSAYDGATTTDASTFDVDHVVPLANAYQSGAWNWPTSERTQYANLPFDLWLVSAAANRAKGDSSPDAWRPPDHAIWCTYAQRWIDIKNRWQLTVTTSERDALGQMLDTCTDPTPTQPSTEQGDD
jgi:hypothetical protein